MASRLATRLRYLRFSVTRRRMLLFAGVFVGLGIIWIAITGYLARQQVSALGARIQTVKVLVTQGRVDEAQRIARDIPAMAQRAHRLTTGPAWWIGAHIPYLGQPLDVTRDVAAVGDRIGSDAVPKLIHLATVLNPQTLRASGSTIRIAPLAKAHPELVEVAATLNSADRQLARSPSDTWLGAVNAGRDELSVQLSSMQGYVVAAARASQVLPTMLGGSGPRTYFIGLQSEAELRGTGGLPGAFTIATANHGTLRFTRFESDGVLLPKKTQNKIATGLDFGRDFASAYGPSEPTSAYVDSNVSPHFPYAAQIWAAMWQKVSGQKVDGVLAVDPTTLGYFLDVVGAVSVPGAPGGFVTGKNVVALTERDEYTLFRTNAVRKAFNVAVVKASAKKLTSGSGSAVNLIRAASLASSERRLLVWTRDPAIEKVLEESDYAGTIPRGSRPFSAPILNNAAAGKLDYYLSRSMSYSRTGCGAMRDVLVTISLTNDAPGSGLPAYVNGRLDDAAKSARPGDNRTLLDYYATSGALLQSVTLNGKPSTAAVEQGLGHPIFRVDLELPRGTTQTVVLHLDEPAGRGSPRIWRQPGVTPLDVRSFDQTCGS